MKSWHEEVFFDSEDSNVFERIKSFANKNDLKPGEMIVLSSERILGKGAFEGQSILSIVVLYYGK
jgi:hypothetical protein